MYTIWIEDCRIPQDGYLWIKNVNDAIAFILANNNEIELLDLDHDASYDYARNGGDYIKILDWLEETGRNYPIRIHTANPVGRENMRRIIQKNGWREIWNVNRIVTRELNRLNEVK